MLLILIGREWKKEKLKIILMDQVNLKIILDGAWILTHGI